MSAAELLAIGAGIGSGAIAAGLGYCCLYHNSQVVAPVISRIESSGSVALTFDDGPTPRFTEPILKLLAKANVQATFFCIGENILANRSLVSDMLSAGHCIGNHTWNHDHTGIFGSKSYWHRQVERTSDLIAELSGSPPRVFRAPMGFKTWQQAAAVRAAHMRYIGWRSWAWDTTNVSPQGIYRRITRRLAPGDIVLLHDGLEYARRQASQAATVAALPEILSSIIDRGWRAVSLGAL